jgi:FkbM family methyltransferase
MALSIRVRANRRQLFGIYAPASALMALVPEDRVAIDAGANFGVYCWYIAQRATEVHAFEPQPHHFRRLVKSEPGNVKVHPEALSDHDGVASLQVPLKDGEASLRELSGPVRSLEVPLRTLDSYGFRDIGFFKIDVEGHEEALLHGSIETLRRSDATVFVEIEERHNPGGLDRIVAWLAEIGYDDVTFLREGALHPFAGFDADRDQPGDHVGGPAYVNNFVFRRSPRLTA